MDSYLDVLKEKAKNIGANIEHCGYDKECITEVLALKVRTNLQDEALNVIKAKAIAIEANILCHEKEDLLDAIEEQIKRILEKENELHSSIELQQNFIPFDLG